MNIKKENRNISSLIENCKLRGITITDRKDYLIGLDDFLNQNLIKTWGEVTLFYSFSINPPKDDSIYGKFLSLSGKLSYGWIGYITDSELFNRDSIRSIAKDLFDLDIDLFKYFDWCWELGQNKCEEILQEYWNRLDNNGRESLLNLYMEKLIQAIIDVFCISLNREDFDRIFNNLEPDVREDLLKFDLI